MRLRERIPGKVKDEGRGLTPHERERLTGPPRSAMEITFGNSALVFCILLSICALIAGASRIARTATEASEKAAAVLLNIPATNIDNDNASTEPIREVTDQSAPSPAASNTTTSGAPTQTAPPSRVPPDL